MPLVLDGNFVSYYSPLVGKALTYSKTLESDSLTPKTLFFLKTKFGVNLCFRIFVFIAKCFLKNKIFIKYFHEKMSKRFNTYWCNAILSCCIMALSLLDFWCMTSFFAFLCNAKRFAIAILFFYFLLASAVFGRLAKCLK